MQCIHPAQVAYLHKDFQMAYKSITLVKELLQAKDTAIVFWQPPNSLLHGAAV